MLRPVAGAWEPELPYDLATSDLTARVLVYPGDQQAVLCLRQTGAELRRFLLRSEQNVKLAFGNVNFMRNS